jgi:hypothetical protein
VPEVAAPDVAPVVAPEAVPEDVAGVPEVAPDEVPPEVPFVPDGAEPVVEVAPALEGVPELCPIPAPDCPAEEDAFDAPQPAIRAARRIEAHAGHGTKIACRRSEAGKGGMPRLFRTDAAACPLEVAGA